MLEQGGIASSGGRAKLRLVEMRGRRRDGAPHKGMSEVGGVQGSR